MHGGGYRGGLWGLKPPTPPPDFWALLDQYAKNYDEVIIR